MSTPKTVIAPRDTPCRTLHLDQAARTGWALFADGECTDAGRVLLKGKTPEERAARLCAFVAGLACYHGPLVAVTLEDVHCVRFQRRQGNPAVVLARLLGAAHAGLAQRGFNVQIQKITDCRQVFGLHTNEALLLAASKCTGGLVANEDAAAAWLHGKFWWATAARGSVG